MKFIPRQIAGVFAIFVLLLPIPAKSAADVTIFAAASLKNVLEAAFEGFPTHVSMSFGGSGTIARQVAAGAPADLVVLANTQWMDWLAQRGVIDGEARSLASNRLVLIGPSGQEPLNPDHIAGHLGAEGRLALGDTLAVPAGIYAREAITALGIWDAVQSQLAPTDNVRHALAFVARGEAPLGIVYASDAIAEPRVSVLHEFDAALHSPIRYPAGVVSGGNSDEARMLLEHLKSQSSIFDAAGFLPADMP